MPELPQSSDFKSIVLNNTPLIDVRAPIEFNKGAFPHAVNFPLMSDEERHLVGIKYKEEGNAQAVKLGHELVSGDVKRERVEAWSNFIDSNPHAKLYCFRGGQRSKISQEWISETSKEIVRLKGGYKAFRNYLMQEIEESPSHFKPIILGGRTGSGKTILLKKIENSIDLEGLANHRGSSFGRKTTPQPTQINFENDLAYDLIQKLDKGFEHLVFEDEGKRVGNIFIPTTFALYLSQAPLIILETPDVERIEITFNEYVLSAQESYQNIFKDDYLREWKNDIKSAMQRISKRMGSERYKIVCDIFENAFNEQINNGNLELYKDWVAYLLKEYYDPMYDYQIQKHSERVVFRGSHEEIISYLHTLFKKRGDPMIYKSEQGDLDLSKVTRLYPAVIVNMHGEVAEMSLEWAELYGDKVKLVSYVLVFDFTPLHEDVKERVTLVYETKDELMATMTEVAQLFQD